DEVERERQVAEKGEQKEFVTARYALVSQQAARQDGAVRHEPGQRLCVFTTPRGDQPDYEDAVEEHRRPERDDQPGPPRHAVTLPEDREAAFRRCAVALVIRSPRLWT